MRNRVDQGRDFWSQRRARVAAEAQAEQSALVAQARAAEDARLAERTDEEILADLGLPQPEELTSAEAVQNFLKSAVPQRLKTRALRKLWVLNPVLANLDGLVDYGEDFTDSATVIENMQTAYQVGKGMLKTLIEDEAPAAEEEPQDAPEEDPENLVIAHAEQAPLPEADPDPLPAARRRMRFSFET